MCERSVLTRFSSICLLSVLSLQEAQAIGLKKELDVKYEEDIEAEMSYSGASTGYSGPGNYLPGESYGGNYGSGNYGTGNYGTSVYKGGYPGSGYNGGYPGSGYNGGYSGSDYPGGYSKLPGNLPYIGFIPARPTYDPVKYNPYAG